MGLRSSHLVATKGAAPPVGTVLKLGTTDLRVLGREVVARRQGPILTLGVSRSQQCASRSC